MSTIRVLVPIIIHEHKTLLEQGNVSKKVRSSECITVSGKFNRKNCVVQRFEIIFKSVFHFLFFVLFFQEIIFINFYESHNSIKNKVEFKLWNTCVCVCMYVCTHMCILYVWCKHDNMFFVSKLSVKSFLYIFCFSKEYSQKVRSNCK